MEQADLPGPRRRLRREGDGERAPEGGGEKPHAGCPASGAPPPLFAAGPSASAWAGHSLKMSWGWGGTWDGWGPRRGWLRGRHVGPSPPGPRPPSHSLDGHSANPASPRAVQGSHPEARPGARGDTKCAFSKLRTCGPANPSLSGWPALHETPQAHSILGRRAGARWPQPCTTSSIPWTGPSRQPQARTAIEVYLPTPASGPAGHRL